jgi:hypothetical protein
MNNHVEIKWFLQPPRLCKKGCYIVRVTPAGEVNVQNQTKSL